MNGAFFLHRKILDSPIYSDPHLLRFWIYCLSKATYKEREVIIEKTVVHLKEGQFVTGRKSLKREYNDTLSEKEKKPESTLWSWLLRLEKWGNVDIKSTNKYSVVTIVNWIQYQKDLTTNQQQIDNSLTTNQQQIDTNNKDNNDNNDNNKEITVVAKAKPKRTNKKDEYDPNKYKTRKTDLLLFEDDVYMTSEEYDTLVNKYGKGKTDYMINYYNSYVIQEGYREDKESKNDYIGVNKWIAGGYGNYKENKINTTKQEKSDNAIIDFVPNENGLLRLEE